MANGKAYNGKFVPTNPQKYVGTYPITYRSSWEYAVMQKFDIHPNVVAWASESVSIPYRNPLKMQWSVYIPDFLVVYVDAAGRKHCDMIEVKPLKETPGFKPKRLTEQLKLTQAINAAKWAAATEYCAKRGWNFRVATEDLLFRNVR